MGAAYGRPPLATVGSGHSLVAVADNRCIPIPVVGIGPEPRARGRPIVYIVPYSAITANSLPKAMTQAWPRGWIQNSVQLPLRATKISMTIPPASSRQRRVVHRPRSGRRRCPLGPGSRRGPCRALSPAPRARLTSPPSLWSGQWIGRSLHGYSPSAVLCCAAKHKTKAGLRFRKYPAELTVR